MILYAYKNDFMLSLAANFYSLNLQSILIRFSHNEGLFFLLMHFFLIIPLPRSVICVFFLTATASTLIILKKSLQTS